ncbi:hypothetical protein ELY15_12365 [Legionella sp. km772]|nr:hypothetical protein ELY15_12365 [Legionella sp. km772]
MNFIKTLLALFVTLFSGQNFADDLIEITVVATDKAMAVGYLVEGKKLGGLGKTYSGKGPVNKQYFFGYRKNALSGRDISCGSVVLNKSTKVQLVTKGKQCYAIVN